MKNKNNSGSVIVWIIIVVLVITASFLVYRKSNKTTVYQKQTLEEQNQQQRSQDQKQTPEEQKQQRSQDQEQVQENQNQNDNLQNYYVDGQLYVKIENSIVLDPGVFDPASRFVDTSKLPQTIQNIFNLYNVSKVERSFFFSNNISLQRILRVYFNDISLTNQLISDLSHLSEVEFAEKIPLNTTQ